MISLRLGDISQILSGGDKPITFSKSHTATFNIPVYANALEKEGLIGYTNKASISSNSITVASRGSNCGEVFYRDKPYLPVVRLITVIPDEEIINCKYLYYYLKNVTIKSSGSGQPQITIPQISELRINILKNIEEQREIAESLSVIDTKRKNNNLILTELNNMLKDIYDYWFIQFDFPNEDGKPYKLSKGKMIWNEELHREIPEGWTVRKFGDLIIENEKSKVQVGDAINSDGTIPFFTSGDDVLRVDLEMVDGINIYLNTGGNANAKFYNGKASYSTDTWCIKGKNNLTNYLALYLLSIKEYLYIKFFHGTGLKHLQKPLLKNELILVPEEVVLERINRIVDPITLEIGNCLNENYNLVKFRDFILPLLMNGQVELKSKDKKVEYI